MIPFSLRERIAQIVDRTLQSEELIAVRLGNIDSQSIMKGDNEIGEIHRIEVEDLAKVVLIMRRSEIGFWRDFADEFQNERSEFGVGHSFSGSCKKRPTAVKYNPPMWPSVILWSAARLLNNHLTGKTP
jgi:hypothetical protein